MTVKEKLFNILNDRKMNNLSLLPEQRKAAHEFFNEQFMKMSGATYGVPLWEVYDVNLETFGVVVFNQVTGNELYLAL